MCLEGHELHVEVCEVVFVYSIMCVSVSCVHLSSLLITQNNNIIKPLAIKSGHSFHFINLNQRIYLFIFLHTIICLSRHLVDNKPVPLVLASCFECVHDLNPPRARDTPEPEPEPEQGAPQTLGGEASAASHSVDPTRPAHPRCFVVASSLPVSSSRARVPRPMR